VLIVQLKNCEIVTEYIKNQFRVKLFDYNLKISQSTLGIALPV